MSEIKQTYTISATIDEVWRALTNSSYINQWGAGPNALMNEEAGKEFNLWDGYIIGKNTKVVINNLLEQEWKAKEWDKSSKVIFTLKAINSNETELTLIHTDFPSLEQKDLEEGWKNEYISPLKSFLEKKK